MANSKHLYLEQTNYIKNERHRFTDAEKGITYYSSVLIFWFTPYFTLHILNEDLNKCSSNASISSYVNHKADNLTHTKLSLIILGSISKITTLLKTAKAISNCCDQF
ncbi:hypothetical protein CDL12_14953 [Handroanthus impetiginosus]|uniref:Uncharacterized protein n=1 Tax=Handroanthus impetiginosus TaxID=429701 RepID=A0A2G9H4K5_9LAMI|nr:hypothetical protein CDL12_14953 [Handroanthus impetiginosus]